MTVFLWILFSGTSDLVPEVNRHAEFSSNFISFITFTAGLALLFGARLIIQHYIAPVLVARQSGVTS